MVDFSKYKIKGESKKLPEEKISPDIQDEKIIPGVASKKVVPGDIDQKVLGDNDQKKCINALPEKKITSGKKDMDPQLSKSKIAVKQTEINISSLITTNMSSLITALTYAINTIKNKKAVKDKEINSTYYQYYLGWNNLRKSFMKQLNLI